MRTSLLALLIMTVQATASPVPDFPFIAVSGQASKEVPPDKATINFTVLCHDADSEVAVASINKTLKGLVEGIVGLGISKNAITADNFFKWAVREKGENFTQLKILGYDASREVKVTLSTVELYTSVVRLILATNGVTKIDSKFDSSSRDKIEAELLASACMDAKRKANLMCTGVGTTLGDVFAISDRNFTTLSDFIGFGHGLSDSDPFGAAPLPGLGEEVPFFVPAKFEIQASVNVLYRLGSTVKREPTK